MLVLNSRSRVKHRKITFLAILDPDTGAIQRGTFLGTRMDSNSQGRVSGLGISPLSVSASGSIDLKGSACYDEGTATNSIATDKSCSVGCTGNLPWSGSLSATLSTLSSGKCLRTDYYAYPHVAVHLSYFLLFSTDGARTVWKIKT